MNANDVRRMFAAMDYATEMTTMNGHTQAGIDATQPDDYDDYDALEDAIGADMALDAERHARHMDAVQYQARIAELERQVAELTAWRDAVPMLAIGQLYQKLPVQYGVLAHAMEDIGAWFDTLDAQDAANDAAMAKWDAGK